MLLEIVGIVTGLFILKKFVDRLNRLRSQGKIYVPTAEERRFEHAKEVTKAYGGHLIRINNKAKRNLLDILFRAGEGKSTSRQIARRNHLRDQRDALIKSWRRDVRNITNIPKEAKTHGIHRDTHKRGRWNL